MKKTNNNKTHNFNQNLNTFWVNSLTKGYLTPIYGYIFPFVLDTF